MNEIVDFIPYGKENAIPRRDLCRVTGLNDRVLRDRIATARREHAILNFGNGYFRPDDNDADDVKHWMAQETSRATEIARSLEGAWKFLNKS